MIGNDEAKAPVGVPEDDPWAAAFAALEQEDGKDTVSDEAASDVRSDGADKAGTDSLDGNAGNDDQAELGGPVPADAEVGVADGIGEAGDSWTPEEVAQEVEAIKQGIESAAIQEVRELLIKNNIRHNKETGFIGATINDPDIYRRDEKGIPVFINPDTGKPFTGDNPRAQAKKWVDDYNEELQQVFNQEVNRLVQEGMKDSEPTIKMLEFAPTFEKLDNVRARMFESIVEDYEIKSGDEVIGYSCDLNAVLNQVNRMVQRIQASNQAAAQAPTGPAVDMAASAHASAEDDGKVENLAQAMERIQQRELEKLKKKGR